MASKTSYAEDIIEITAKYPWWPGFRVELNLLGSYLELMPVTEGGYVVASGQFTRDAVKFANKNNIEFLTGNTLKENLGSTNRATVFFRKLSPRLNRHRRLE